MKSGSDRSCGSAGSRLGHAIEMANASRFGLSAGLISDNVDSFLILCSEFGRELSIGIGRRRELVASCRLAESVRAETIDRAVRLRLTIVPSL